MLRAGAVGVLALLAFASPACSFIFVEPLPATHHAGDRTECTSSLTAPIVDSAFALGYAGTAVYVGTRDNISNKGPAVALSLVDAAVTVSSAIYGYVETGECRAAKQESETPFPIRGLGTTPPTGYPFTPPAPGPAPPATLGPGQAPRM